MKITEKQTENFTSYNTDKFHGNDKSKPHAYGDYYDELLGKLQNSEISLLEIGVNNGGSVRLFHDYLNKAKIVGVDIHDYWNYKKKSDYDRLDLFYFNAYDEEKMKLLPIQEYDIIIDDGPHTIDSQIYFLNNFTKYLKNGGKLILEDVPRDNLTTILDSLKINKKNISVFRFDLVTNHWDDIIIEYKNDNNSI